MPSLSGGSNPAPTTTSPPMPDLYKASYAFSSSSSSSDSNTAPNQKANSGSGRSSSTALYDHLINTISQPSAPSTTSSVGSSQSTSTSVQDVMNAYAKLQGSTSQSGQDPYQALVQQYTAAMGGNSGSISQTTDYTALLQKYGAGTSGGSAGSTSTGATDFQSLANQFNTLMGGSSSGSVQSLTNEPQPTQISYQSLVDQYNKIMNPSSSNSGGSGTTSDTASSYEQLMQQYNQIMGYQNPATSASSPTLTPLMSQYLSAMSQAQPSANTGTGLSSPEQLLQMYSQMLAGPTTGPTSSPGTSTNTGTSATPSSSSQDTFEHQLLTLFPQFKTALPQTTHQNTSTSSTSTSSTDPAATQTAQMIFDALLFGPAPSAQNQSQGGASTNGQLPQPTPGTSSTPTLPSKPFDAMQNMVTSKSGSTVNCNCMNRCPFPRVNSLKFGYYCVCCPPGVTEQVINMMSVVRGAKYTESPLTVIS